MRFSSKARPVIGMFFMLIGGTVIGAEQGVTDEVIRIGQVSDLSGATAVWGVPSTNGTRMRIDEVNAAGGIHGRKLELIVEDGQYQVPVSVKAANKLLNRDKVFLMLGNIGTPANNAILPRQLRMGVANLFPVTAAATMHEPLHPMKFAYGVSYRDQVRGAVKYMTAKTGARKVCLQTQATDYGHEAELGYERAVEEHRLESVYVGRHKVAETDFVGSVTRLKNTGCEILFLGTIFTDTIQLYTAVRNAGWNVPVVGNMVVLHPMIAEAADGGLEGLYSASPLVMANLDEDSDEGRWRRDWYAKYKMRFGEDANVQAQLGYVTADLTIKALESAGRELTMDKLLRALENIRNFPDPFGGPPLSFGPRKHQGADTLYLSQIVDGKWTVLEKNLDYRVE